MRKFTIPLLLMLILGLLSCKKYELHDILDDHSSKTDKEYEDTCDHRDFDCDSVPILASKKLFVGNLSFAVEEEHLIVKVHLKDHWKLKASHLYVGLKRDGIDGIPLNKGGNPKVGHYPYKAEHDYRDKYIFKIPLREIGEDVKCLIFSYHAEVVRAYEDKDCDHYKTETAWAKGEQLPGANWAMYFSCCLED